MPSRLIRESAAPTPAFISFSFPGVGAVRCLFSTAAAGNMSLAVPESKRGATVENRRRFMRAAGFADWAETRQVHGDAIVGIAVPRLPKTGEMEAADGMYTFEKDVGLVIKTADCQPILLARDDGGAVAALHSGWRGNAANFPGTAVERLCRKFSCKAENLLAVRGPSLGPVASEFINFAREWPPGFEPWFDSAGKTVDLWALTRRQLEGAGLRPDRVFALDMCTRDMADCFFSHRRGDAGRQVAAIWIRRRPA